MIEKPLPIRPKSIMDLIEINEERIEGGNYRILKQSEGTGRDGDKSKASTQIDERQINRFSFHNDLRF